MRKILMGLTVSTVLTAGWVIAAPEAKPQTEMRLPPELMLFEGQSSVFPVKKIQRIAIGNSDLVATTILNTGELVLTADKVGETTMQVWFTDGTRTQIAIVIAQSNSPREIKEIKELLRNVAGIRISAVGSRVIVDGDLQPRDLERVNLVKARYPNMLVLAQPLTEFNQKMVYFDVKVMEFNKDDVEELGINWLTNISGPGLRYSKALSANPYFRSTDPGDPLANAVGVPPPNLGAVGSVALQKGGLTYFGIASEITSRINFLETQGSAVTLASPRLSTRSGGKAKLTVGGQVPVVSSSANGQTVTYKDFGILLEIEPKLDPYGNLVASVGTEISQVDKSNQVGDFPAFRTRRTNNDVAMKNGETLVLSGLITTEDQVSYSKVKGLADIPVLGSLFQSKSFKGGKTELVVFITPEVIEDLGSGSHKSEKDRGDAILERLNRQLQRDLRE